ncbi:hypothetical protein Syun_022194 [Stephania yunnanensis]|uniref:Peroxisomal assembly protein PEX3 n=1 Tax=Stephania yunnanensis TaxID=152371 RepID=A0AAP0IIZ3_9MAGN
MLALRDFWRRHRRKGLVTLGICGSGYLLYKFYVAHRRRLVELDILLEGEKQTDEIIKNQQQAHFENIQRIADSTTLPYAMHYLQSRISDELDPSYLTERLMQAKGESNALTSLEKLELWDRLKILSFTRLVSSIWAMTSLCLYIRVQVNILGRHLYIDIARDLGSSHLLDEGDPFDRHSQKEFLSTADFLANHGIFALIPCMQTAVTEVLKGKHLRDPFNTSILRESLVQILDTFMNIEGPNHWISYVLPENAISYKHLTATSSNFEDAAAPSPDISKLDQLMEETRNVLSSTGFRNIMEISLKSVVDMLTEEFTVQSRGLSSGVPLAKLLPLVSQMGPSLLEDPSGNQFVKMIGALHEVELFYTLLYANMTPDMQSCYRN